MDIGGQIFYIHGKTFNFSKYGMMQFFLSFDLLKKKKSFLVLENWGRKARGFMILQLLLEKWKLLICDVIIS